MATGETSAAGSSEDRRESLTCSLCLDIFTQPKLLPCSHSFCLKCLEKLTSHHSSPTFPCPHCRADVTIPESGVSAFQNNFYIHPQDLDLAREGTQCLTHPKQDLDLYCVDCQLPVCLKCVLTKHKQHNTQDLSEAASEANAQLSQDEDRLQKAVSYMTQEVEAEKKEQQALQDKKAVMQTAIQNKHATIVAMADKYRDELLTSLNTACDKMEGEVTEDLTPKTSHLQELCQLQQQLQKARSSGTACTQVTVAKEMRDGKGSVQAINRIMSTPKRSMARPVVNSTLTVETLMQKVQDFFGTVDTVWMTQTPPEVVVEEKFTCRQEKDTEVYCLCPSDNGKVWVSYVNCGLQKNIFSNFFQENGKCEKTSQKAFGKASWKSRGNGKYLVRKSSESGINSHSKYVGDSILHLKLCNHMDGKASIKREKVVSDDPLMTQKSTEFTINVGVHRAFDVDSSEQLFAVVEESQTPDHPREVKLYERNKPDAVATYTSPSKPFNPSDVCFFTLGGQEVLLIADETGDNVHVVHVQNNTMTFVRYLAPGCPLLVQPTALNTDHRGRLWVACRGGRILTMSPMMP